MQTHDELILAVAGRDRIGDVFTIEREKIPGLLAIVTKFAAVNGVTPEHYARDMILHFIDRPDIPPLMLLAPALFLWSLNPAPAASPALVTVTKEAFAVGPMDLARATKDAGTALH